MPTTEANETKQSNQALRAEVRSKLNRFPEDKLGYFSILADVVERHVDCWTPEEDFIISLLEHYSRGYMDKDRIGRLIETFDQDMADTERVAKFWQERASRLSRKEAA